MSSVSSYTPGGYIAKFTQSVAEETAKRKQQTAALADAVNSSSDAKTQASDADAGGESAAVAETGGTTETTGAGDAAATKTAEEELAEFKKNFQKNIRSLTLNRHFILTKISLDIDDAGYEKMMADPAYEQKVMSKIREQMGSTLTAAPAGVNVKVTGQGEKIEASGTGQETSPLGLAATAGQTPVNIRSSSSLDALTSKVSAVLGYRLGSDPMAAAKTLLNRQA